MRYLSCAAARLAALTLSFSALAMSHAVSAAQLADISSKAAETETRQKTVKTQLLKLAADVKEAEERKAALNVLNLAAAGNPGARKSLSELAAPKEDKGSDCAKLFRVLPEIERQAQQAAAKGEQAMQILNSTAQSEPTAEATKAAVKAADITRDMAAQTKAIQWAAGQVEGILKKVGGKAQVDLSGVDAWKARIADYDHRTSGLQGDANAAEQAIKDYDAAREEAIGWMEQQRALLPEGQRTAADPYIARARILLIGESIRQAIVDARKLTWSADQDVGSYRAALARLSDARVQAASSEAEICASYGEAASRQAIVNRTRSQVETLKARIDDLVAVLNLRAGKLEDYGRRNKELLDKAAAKIRESQAAGNATAAAAATRIQKSAQQRQAAIDGESKAIGKAETSAGEGQQATEKGLLGVEAASAGK